MSTNLFYDASVLGLGISVTPSDSFLNTIVGIPKIVNYTIKNTGAKALSNLKLNLDFIGTNITTTSNNCEKAELLAGKECNLELTYNPSSATATSTGKFGITATYKRQVGDKLEDYSIYSETAFDYSAIDGVSLFQVSPNVHSFVAKTDTDGSNSESKVYHIENKSNFDATLGTVNITNTTASNDFVVGSNTCTASPLTAVTGSCDVTARFTPKANYNESNVKLSAPVTGLGTAAITLDFFASLYSSATAVSSPQVVYTARVENIPSFATVISNVTDVTSIEFFMHAGRKVEVKYTFKNGGDDVGVADNFNVDVGGLPSAFEVVSAKTSCPVGKGVRILAANDECDVVVEIPKETYFSAGLLSNTKYNANLKLDYSYEVLGDKASHETKETKGTVVNVSTKLIDTTRILVKAINKESDGYSISLTVNASGLLAKPTEIASSEIKVTALMDGLKPVSASTCDMLANRADYNCDNIIKLPLSFPTGIHYLKVTLAHPENSDYKEEHVVEINIPAATNP